MMTAMMNRLWYTRHPLRWFLFPFALLYQLITTVRRFFLQRFRQHSFAVPIIVVGNLTVGGTGKTPLVLALAERLRSQGIRVGIISRGYHANIKRFPHEVCAHESASLVGDEPLLLAKKSQCPVVIAPKRTQAVQFLLNKHQCQVIISDDGLQHYKLPRAMEIIVIDGKRGLGNGLCLPAGPLREGVSRMCKADFIIVNGGSWPKAHRMKLIPGTLTPLKNEAPGFALEKKEKVAAVAAIGNPGRFFETLLSLGLNFNAYPFADHHNFRADELDLKEHAIVMTEKDAVKCEEFANDKMYFLPVEAQIEDRFWKEFWSHEALQKFI